MEKLNVHIRHAMLWVFENNKNARETAQKMCSIYSELVIADCQVWNWVFKFHSGDKPLRNELIRVSWWERNEML